MLEHRHRWDAEHEGKQEKYPPYTKKHPTHSQRSSENDCLSHHHYFIFFLSLLFFFLTFFFFFIFHLFLFTVLHYLLKCESNRQDLLFIIIDVQFILQMFSSFHRKFTQTCSTSSGELRRSVIHRFTLGLFFFFLNIRRLADSAIICDSIMCASFYSFCAEKRLFVIYPTLIQ